MRSTDALSLPPIDGASGVLVIAFDPALSESRAKAIESSIIAAGATMEAGGPAVDRWWGQLWDENLDWLRDPDTAIHHYFDSSIVGMGMSVTTFVLLALDADESAWRHVLDTTRSALAARPDWRLHMSDDDGRSAEVQRAIADGWPLDEFDADLGYTPLHHACAKNHVDIIKMLIDAGVDVNRNCEAKIGETPLGLVADRCSLEVARLLVDAGADPTIPGCMAITALDRATERTDDEGKAVAALLRDIASRRGRRCR
jgi:Ankyrin repeats (3 copies)